MTENKWPRNLYTGIGGGMYTGIGGGMYTGIGGGAYTGIGGGLYTGIGGGLYAGPSGGMYTGPDSEPYMSNIPPWPHLLRVLDERRFTSQAQLIRRHLPEMYWPENYFTR